MSTRVPVSGLPVGESGGKGVSNGRTRPSPTAPSKARVTRVKTWAKNLVAQKKNIVGGGKAFTDSDWQFVKKYSLGL